MAECAVPQSAYDAAVALTDESRARLAAAAPHIAAAALRQAAEHVTTAGVEGAERRVALIVGAWRRFLADDTDGRRPEPDTREGILAAAGLTEADMRRPPDEVCVCGGQLHPDSGCVTYEQWVADGG